MGIIELEQDLKQLGAKIQKPRWESKDEDPNGHDEGPNGYPVWLLFIILTLCLCCLPFCAFILWQRRSYAGEFEIADFLHAQELARHPEVDTARHKFPMSAGYMHIEKPVEVDH